MQTLSCLALSVSLVFAAGANAAPAVSTKATVDHQTMCELEGAYALENGRIVRLVIADDRLHVELNSHLRKELYRVEDRRFTTRDNSVSVEFGAPASGLVERIVMHYDADSTSQNAPMVAMKATVKVASVL